MPRCLGGGGAGVRLEMRARRRDRVSAHCSFPFLPFANKLSVGFEWPSGRSCRATTRLLAGVAALTLLCSASLAQQGPFLYVPNFADGTVSVVDTPTNMTVPPAITVQTAPITAGVRGDQSLIYVTNRVSNSVSVIDTATNTIVTNIVVGGSPNGLAVTPDGTRVYVGQETGNVVVIDATTNTVTATIPVGTLPSGVKVNPAGTRIYVANNGGNSVSVIDTGTNTVIATILVGLAPGTPTVSPEGTRVYVNNGNSNSVSVINTATNTVVTTITVGIGSLPFSVAFNKDGTRAYVPNFSSNTVSVINTATNTVIATIPVGTSPAGVAVTPDGTQLYVTNNGGGSVSVIDTATNTVIATVPVGSQPTIGPGICYNGNALLAAGRTFTANTSGAIACTLGSIGSTGPSFSGGTLLIAGPNIASALPITLQAGGGTIDTQGNSATLSGVISGPGALTKQGTGMLTLGGMNLYTGATTVNAGTLFVTGSIASSVLTTVNNGATLAGTGTVGTTMINGGGLFAPGPMGGTPGSMTVQGNLTFQPGAFYRVQVAPPNASSAVVTGTATLAGTVQAAFQGGSYVHSYTILSATGGRVGTFDALTTTNLPVGFVPSLSYTANAALLNLTAVLGQNLGLTVNQQNVASTINGFFNGGGTLPPEFFTLFGLAGGSLPNALAQLSGELGTGMSQAAFQSMSLFLNLMLDPFVTGRFGGNWTNGPALAFEPDRPLPPQATRSMASLIAASAPIADTFDRRWKVWGSGYGGYNKTGGDTAVGSHDLTARAYGFAAGLDYRLWPSTIVGFALGGAGTNWGLADSLGSGRSDAFQSGVYASTRYGPAYLSAALAYEWHQVSTERTVTIAGADRLTADFHANSLGARVESGYRFGFGGPEFGFTPYAALQTLSVRTPNYAERAASGSAVFALGYNGQTTTATRSELGAWVDHRFALPYYQSLVLLRARAAWAHDFESDRQIVSIFQALPGASFTVQGASRPRDAALLSAGAELRLINGWAFAAKFDGEFASRSYTYAGTGSVRYAW